MKIHILSDLHIERWKFEYTQPDCDVIVLAGDIGAGFLGIEWINEHITGDIPVLYLPGNHEFYGESLWEHPARLAFRAKECEVEFMHNRTFIHNGVRFIGATLWTDFNLLNDRDRSMLAAPTVISDYNIIFQEPDDWTAETVKPYMILSEHEVSRKFIIDELNKPFDGETVVITHHAPSEMSIGANYRDSKHSSYYASRLENLMLNYDIKLWAHGHIHSTSDYMIGDTRVIANPRGSDVHPNKTFDPHFIVEI
jgi:predicted phosphodiesterase